MRQVGPVLGPPGPLDALPEKADGLLAVATSQGRLGRVVKRDVGEHGGL
jgi:hypothetical protein